jgi:hypothetical protein
MIQWDKVGDCTPLDDIERACKYTSKSTHEPDTLIFPRSILEKYECTVEELEAKFGAKILLF